MSDSQPALPERELDEATTLAEGSEERAQGLLRHEVTTSPRSQIICPSCGSSGGENFCTGCGQKLFKTVLLLPGTLIRNQYEVVRELGQGSFGATYLVRDRNLDGKEWVIKVLLSVWGNHEQALNYFRQEANLLARLEHTGIPKVFNFFEWKGHFLLIQDKVPGRSYDKVIEAEGPRSVQEAEQVLRAVLSILLHLHEVATPPVIHRDIKPANLMKTPTDEVWLIDFGAFKRHRSDTAEYVGTSSTSIYTRGYAPPEQIEGREVGPEADLYALGITILVMLTGRRADEIDERTLGGAKAMMASHRSFVEVIEAMIQRDPTRRPKSARSALEWLNARRNTAPHQAPLSIGNDEPSRYDTSLIPSIPKLFEPDPQRVSEDSSNDAPQTKPTRIIGEAFSSDLDRPLPPRESQAKEPPSSKGKISSDLFKL